MRSLITILMIAVLSFVATWFLPWWMIAVMSFLIAVVMQPVKSFWVGFAGIALMWFVVILFKEIPNRHILSTRMAGVFGLPNAALLIVVNLLLGGLIGGLSSWSGKRMLALFK